PGTPPSLQAGTRPGSLYSVLGATSELRRPVRAGGSVSTSDGAEKLLLLRCSDQPEGSPEILAEGNDLVILQCGQLSTHLLGQAPESCCQLCLSRGESLQQYQVGGVGDRTGLRMQIRQYVHRRLPRGTWWEEILRCRPTVQHDQQRCVFRGARQLHRGESADLHRGRGLPARLSRRLLYDLPGSRPPGGHDHPGTDRSGA